MARAAGSNRSDAGRLLLSELERLMAEALGVIVRIEEVIGRAARMRERCIQLLLLDLRIARDRPPVANERRDRVALHPRHHIGRRRHRQRLRNHQRVAELVDFDDMRNVAAAVTAGVVRWRVSARLRAGRRTLSASCACPAQGRHNAHLIHDVLEGRHSRSFVAPESSVKNCMKPARRKMLCARRSGLRVLQIKWIRGPCRAVVRKRAGSCQRAGELLELAQARIEGNIRQRRTLSFVPLSR